MDLLGLTLLGDSYLQLGIFLAVITLMMTLGKCRPSRRLFFLLALPLPLMLLGFYAPELLVLNEGLKFYNPMILALVMIDRFLLAPDFTKESNQLGVNRSMAERFSIRQNNVVQIQLVNPTDRIITGEWVDDFPEVFQRVEQQQVNQQTVQKFQLYPHQQETVSYLLRPLKRGAYEFGKINLRYLSPLGLVWIHLKGGRSQTVKVYPDLQQIKAMRIRYSKSMSVGELQKRKLGAEGTQFEGLRGYFTGDDFRKMDWKATARLDVPIVRTFTHEVEQPILVLLDAGRKMQAKVLEISKFDWALNASLAFAGVALDRGDQLGVSAFHQDIVVNTGLGVGQKHFRSVLENLSGLQPEALEPDYESVMLQVARSLKKRTLIIVFTDLIDPMASRSLLRGLQTFSKNHLLVVVTLNNTEMLGAATTVPETELAAYEKGVTLDLLEVRRRTLMELSKVHGATVIDTTPERLSESLIDHYLSVKLKSTL